jgi:hypothetical protein
MAGYFGHHETVKSGDVKIRVSYDLLEDFPQPTPVIMANVDQTDWWNCGHVER